MEQHLPSFLRDSQWAFEGIYREPTLLKMITTICNMHSSSVLKLFRFKTMIFNPKLLIKTVKSIENSFVNNK